MLERPILFSGPMVRALLDGSKTQTRRIVNPRMVPLVEEVFRVNGYWTSEVLDGTIVGPYGQPGDCLWVRETWGYRGRSSSYNVDGVPGRQPWDMVYLQYQADGEKRDFKRENDYDKGLPKQKPGSSNDELVKWWASWRPSIHMSRWMSRLTLEIVSMRVERLQNISDANAIAEGIEWIEDGVNSGWKDYVKSDMQEITYTDPRDSFRSLWESINGPGSWGANPWVWVVEFRRAPEQEKAP